MLRLAVLAAMLCGCAQLFGLDETSGSSSATMTIQRVSIGASIVYAPQDLSTSMATYLVPDEVAPSGLSRVAVAQTEPGTWTAPITQPAPILFDLPDYPKPVLRIFDFPNVNVKALYGVLEHPNPQPAPEGAMINVNATLDAAYTGAETFSMYTLGSWSSIGLAVPAVGTVGPIVQTFAFASMSSLSGRTPLERITSADAVVVLRHVGSELRGAFKAPPFDQTGNDTITGTMTTVPIAPFTFAIDQMAATQRFSTARPLVGTPTMSWRITAAPGAQLNSDQGPLLAAGSATTPTTVTSQAGNPFAPDWPSVVLWSTRASRTYTPPAAALPVTLSAGMDERALLAPGLEMKLPAGLPARITLNGTTLLDNDGVTIAKPARGVEVTFTTDRETNTLYQLQLFKLIPNAGNTALEYEQRLSAAAAAPRFVLPPELFEAGAHYTLRVMAIQGGFDGVAQGDLTLRSLPLALSFIDSGVFQVSP